MKKALLFAIAALCVSAAQAVTVNWYSTNPTTANKGASAENLYSDAKEGIAGVQLGLDDAGITDKVAITRVNFAINSTNDFINNTNVMTSIYAQLTCDAETIVEGVRAKLYTNNASIKYSNTGTAGEAHAGANQPYNNLGKYAFLSFDLEGVELDHTKTYTLMFYSDATCDTHTAVKLLEQSAITDNDNVYLDANGGELSTAAALVWYEGVIVPEPTALALLALGVAGLALKRKVA